MGCLGIKASECWYKEKNRSLKEHVINGINNDDMITEIIRELPAVEKYSGISRRQILAWTRRIEAQRA